jgi:methyl-accepting chemotaxis protein
VLEESLRATEQQREAAEQVSNAMVEIRTAAEQLTAEQQQRTQSAERVSAAVGELYDRLDEFGRMSGAGSPATNGRADPRPGP